MYSITKQIEVIWQC